MQIKQLTTKQGFSTLLIIVAVAIIGAMAVLAFGVLDVWQIKKAQVPSAKISDVDQVIKDLDNLSSSDELPDIERDLTATDLENLDSEMDQIEKDLGEF